MYGPYGYNRAAQLYDDAVGRWVTTLQPDVLLEEAARYVDDAKTCGFSGLVMLQGMLQSLSSVTRWSQSAAGACLANEHPTYFGMMVAAVVPDSNSLAHANLAHLEL